MKYKRKYPTCPFRGKGNNKCSHKGRTICNHLKHPENCPLYNEWSKLIKVYSRAVSDDFKGISKRGSGDKCSQN